MLTYKRISIIPQTTYTVTRRIPGQGQIFCRVGQKVKAYEIIGVGEKKMGFKTLNLADLLKVKPRLIKNYLCKNIGSIVYQDEVIAKKKEFWGLREVEIVSPIDGVLRHLDEKNGSLQLEYLPKKVKIPAGVSGKIIEVEQSIVRIETKASQICGVIGAGKLKEGMLLILGRPDLPLLAKDIKAEMNGKILAGGSLLDKEVLYKCLAMGVRGVLCGGINFAHYQELTGPRGGLEDVGLGVLILEGFGNLSINRLTYEALQKINGQPVLLYGARSQLIVPHLSEQNPLASYPAKPALTSKGLLNFGILRLHQKVKLLTLNHLGLSGTIKKLNQEPTELLSGVKTNTVLVELEDGREVEVGGWDLEIVE